MVNKKLLIIVTTFIAIILFTGFLVSYSSSYVRSAEIRNVILMIGDGMGVDIVSIARYYSLSVLGEDLHMVEVANNGFTGYMSTHSLDFLVTDSAAAGTALATGSKTNNGMISVLPSGLILETVLERAQKLGKSVGLVTTTRITHATPAAFASHVPSRGMENEIAVQLLEHKVNVLLGGGLRHFIPMEVEGSKRKDSRDLTKEAIAMGYTFVKTRSELLKVDPSETNLLLGLFSMSHMAYEIDRAGTDQPSLAEMTAKAIEILSQNEKGFFLMVEGGRIDHANHANDIAAAIMDTLAFDEAVKVAFDFAKRDGHTLLIITADHVTGQPALTYSRVLKPKARELALLARVNASFEVILNEIKEAGVTVGNVMEVFSRYTGIELSEEEARMIVFAIQNPEMAVWIPSFANQPSDTMGRIVTTKLQGVISWATGGHSATMVPVIAYGPMSEEFKGFLDNTDIGKLIFKALEK